MSDSCMFQLYRRHPQLRVLTMCACLIVIPLALNVTGYYQPAFRDLSDFRPLTDATLTVDIP